MDKVYGGKSFLGREVAIYVATDRRGSTIINVCRTFKPKNGKFIVEKQMRCRSYYQAMVTAHDWNMELYEQLQRNKKTLDALKGGKWYVYGK